MDWKNRPTKREFQVSLLSAFEGLLSVNNVARITVNNVVRMTTKTSFSNEFSQQY